MSYFLNIFRTTDNMYFLYISEKHLDKISQNLYNRYNYCHRYKMLYK